MVNHREGVSKNLLAILLIFAILISAVGTYMAVYNSNNAKLTTEKPVASTDSTVGHVGVFVTNPDISENGDGGGK